MSVIVDEELCAGAGLCERVCPDVFAVRDGISVVNQDAVADNAEGVEEAVMLCPTSALSSS